MPSTLDLCEKYFGTRDIYKLFELTKDSLEKDIKKAYYKLSLKVHPDRVPDSEKEIATEKFKILATLHQVLTDKNKKALYDEQGIIDDDNVDEKLGTWLELWRKIFKPISKEDIDNFKNEFVGSEMERNDIKKAYLNGKGCINYMMNCVPFMSVEDEPRIQDIVKEMIKNGEVPEYKIFTNEPKAKRDRRHKKYAKEAAEAIKILNSKNQENNLEKQIMERQQNRAANIDNFFDNLLQKYGDDNSEEFIFKKSKKKTTTATTSSSKTKQTNLKSNKKDAVKDKNKSTEKGVKSGRVTKRKINK